MAKKKKTETEAVENWFALTFVIKSIDHALSGHDVVMEKKDGTPPTWNEDVDAFSWLLKWLEDYSSLNPALAEANVRRAMIALREAL